MVVLRAAIRNDALAISQVHVASWRATYQGIAPAQFLNELDAGERVLRWQQAIDSGACLLVAESGNRILGFIHGGPIREAFESCDAELYAVYLLEEAQGNGLGTALLVELAKSLRDAGLRRMMVWVLAANESRRFYEKTGAIPVSQREVEIGGALLPMTAYTWPEVGAIAELVSPAQRNQ